MGEFKAKDTVTFVFQDRPPEDWSKLGSLIEELAANTSLGKVADILSVKQEEKEEQESESVESKVKLEGKETEVEAVDEDFDPSQYFDHLNGKDEPESDEDKDDDDFDPDNICDNCGRSFRNRKRLVTHLAECNPEQIDDILSEEDEPRRKRRFELESCDNCLREFKDRNLMVRHLEYCNPEQLDDLPKLKKKKVSSAGGGPYTCKVCQREFIFRKSLLKHELLHSSDPDHASIRKSQGRKKKSESARNDRGQYQCDRCECDFKVFSALERHMESHDLAAKTVPNQADIEEGSGFKMIDIRDGKIMRCKRC